MNRGIRYHPHFSDDVLTATAWYDERQDGLGDSFIESVRRAVNLGLTAPERPTAVDYGMRYWRVTRFPHVVLYDVTDSEVLIVGVMHTAQDATKWLKRHG